MAATPAIRPTAPEAGAVHFRDALAIAGFALVARLVVYLFIAHRHHLSIDQFANLYDGHSYLVMAKAMLGDWSEFDAFHGRVFPAYPAMIALAHLTGIPLPLAAIGIDWLAAALAAALAAVLFADRRVGFAMACFIPHYLMNSTMAMSESPLLALTLAGLVVAQRGLLVKESRTNRHWATSLGGGALLALAALVRPMACFAAGASVALDLIQRKWRAAMLFAAAAACGVALGLLAMGAWRGDALAGIKAQETMAYGGAVFAWPFQSLLTTPGILHDSTMRVGYMWLHVLVVVAGCGILIRRVTRRGAADGRDVLALPWLLGNTAFVLCVGNVWGFECFHRFIVPALPPLFWAWRKVLPQAAWAWVLIAMGSGVVAVLSVA